MFKYLCGMFTLRPSDILRNKVSEVIWYFIFFNVHLIFSLCFCFCLCLCFFLSFCVFYYYLLRMYYTCAMYFDHTLHPLSSQQATLNFMSSFNPLSIDNTDHMHRGKAMYWSMSNLSGTTSLNKFALLPLAVISCQ